MKPWLVAALLATTLAGCVDEGAGPEALLLTLEGGHVIEATLGALRFDVVNEAGLSVPDIRISLPGTDHFGRTGPQGALILLNVTPGPQSFQASGSGFQTYTDDVTVHAGNLTTIDVVLLAERGGNTAHSHDLWAGSDSHPLVDTDVALVDAAGPGAYGPAYDMVSRGLLSPNLNSTTYPIPVEDSGAGPAIVLPGTKTITVTADWDDTTLGELGLCARSADGSLSGCFASSGTPAMWAFDIDAGMADSGHQAFTRWSFSLFHPDVREGAEPAFADVTVAVTITLARGEVILDPPHPAFWEDGSAVVVHDAGFLQAGVCCSGHVRMRPDGLVPPGTTRIEVDHTWSPAGLPIDPVYRLLFRTADQAPTAVLSDYHEGELVLDEPGHRQYTLAVDGLMADPYYASASFWSVGIWNEWAEKDGGFDPHPRPVQQHITITAYNDDL